MVGIESFDESGKTLLFSQEFSEELGMVFPKDRLERPMIIGG
jgi:hypothetical protein